MSDAAAARDAVNTVLKKHGWIFHGMTMEANGTVARYRIVRVADGREATLARMLVDIVSNTIDEACAAVAPQVPVSMTLLVGLLQLAKTENERHPVSA